MSAEEELLGGCISDASFWPASYLAEDPAWVEHIPFAYWLMGSARPRTLVELGTYSGNSFFAFCEGARKLSPGTHLWAVDTWLGDGHVGRYDETIYDSVRLYQQSNHPDRASLIRSTFDEAREKFSPKSIDILHIDGLHTYQAVQHDFDVWVDTLSDSGIVLFHDTAVFHGDFGVWRLWKELTTQYPHFSFEHGNGLGILAVGAAPPSAVEQLFKLNSEQAERVREFYARMGRSIVDWKTEGLAAKKRLHDIERSRSWKMAEFISKLHHRSRAILKMPGAGQASGSSGR